MSSSETPTRRGVRALEAAQWLYDTQKAELAEDPNRPRASITSTRAAAQKFGVSKSTIARQLVALKTGKTDVTTGPRVGRPSRLSEVEEQMLSFHVFMLRRAKQPVNRNVVQDAADALLSRKNPSGPPVSASWVRRWLQADRAQARKEAASKSNGAAPSTDLLEAEAYNHDTDGDLDEDAPSEPEFLDPNLDPSMLVPLVGPAANTHTPIQSRYQSGTESLHSHGIRSE